MFAFSRSVIEQKILFGRSFYLKRDDLIHPICNGNKARKFAALLELDAYKTWISYGGNQSNAMLALAYLAKLKGVGFKYVMPSLGAQKDLDSMQNLSYKANLSRDSMQNNMAMGNLAYALEYGMQPYILPRGSSTAHLESYAKTLIDEHSLFIPQGGSVECALKGMNALAQELAQSIGGEPIIFYSSGSGVGVIALQKALDYFFPKATLIALNCAGSEKELKKKCERENVPHLQILHSPFKFAKPHKEIWAMREYLLNKGVACDLIYDSPAFCLIRQHLESFKHKELVFILSGGLMGDVTQMQRYVSKGFLHK